MGLGLCIAYKALGRNGLQFGMLVYPDGLHSAFMDAYGYCCWSVCPSICPFVRLRHFQVAVHLLTNHYWEMAVAITCGYGGYLLPLLAAHSSLFLNTSKVIQNRWNNFHYREPSGAWGEFINTRNMCIYKHHHHLRRFIYCFNDAVCFIFMYFVRNDEIKAVNCIILYQILS